MSLKAVFLILNAGTKYKRGRFDLGTIAIVSFLPLIVWFCYACRLILITGGHGRKLEGLDIAGAVEAVAVERDYRLISYMMQNGNEFRSEGEDSVDHCMIRIYYRAVQAFYDASRLGPNQVSAVLLQEMVRIVNYMAESMGHPKRASAI